MSEDSKFALKMQLRRARRRGVCLYDEGACACSGAECPRFKMYTADDLIEYSKDRGDHITKVAFIRGVTSIPLGAIGSKKLYKTNGSPEYVVISAKDLPVSGPETYIFESDLEGKITNFNEIQGSIKGTLNHDDAIANAGWELVPAIVRPSDLRILR